MDGKAPALAIMIGKKRKDEPKKGKSDDMDGALNDIAGEAVSAAKAGDAAGFAESMKAFIRACDKSYGGNSEEY